MFRNRRRPRIARVAVAGAAALLAVGIAACSSSSSSSSSSSAGSATSASAGATASAPVTSPTTPAAAAVPGGNARVALPPGVTLNYIFPFIGLANANEYNTLGFEELLYRPLYYFGGNSSSVAISYPLSTASAPSYSADGKTVTIPMKGWKWSNGETVNAADVVFWLNMMKAEYSNFYGYSPGLLPDNLASYSGSGNTVTLHLKSAVSSVWFTYNQLAEINPMPLAWDVTSTGAKAGSGGCATDTVKDKWAKCTAVYNFLAAQAKNVKTYATSPIWGVVDGPWKLTTFSTATAGPVTTFSANKAYSGSPKPQLASMTYYAYTDDSTEYTALKTGGLDVGYIPSQDLPPRAGTSPLPASDPLGSNFTLSPNYVDGIDYFYINYNNPKLGAAFKQLYVRQALQESTDQVGMIKALERGYGYPTSGGVPNEPASQWIPSVQGENSEQGPYPFSVSNAKALLTSHGWSEVGGVMTCQTPALCGAGVAKGTPLQITMDYATGVTFFTQEVAVYKSDLAQVGIALNLVPQSFNTIIGETAPCKPFPSCSTWQALNFGGWNFNGPGFEPTGEPLFQTGAASNAGGFSNATEDKLIGETHTSSSLAVFGQYAAYTAQQLPFIWTPENYTVQAVGSKLANVGFNPLGTVESEDWYFTK